MTLPLAIRPGAPDEDRLVARYFERMWRDNGIPAERIASDWEERTLAFVREARERGQFQSFFAEQDGAIVGTASCQLFAGLYPDVLLPDLRRYGYVWAVYVEPSHRRQGIARALTRAATAHLTSIGCTHALLHASPSGRPVYEGMGFLTTNEMRLQLR